MLKILDLYIKNTSIAAAFAKMKGFALVGQIMKGYAVPEEVLGVLFCMLLGKPTHLTTNRPGATTTTNNTAGNPEGAGSPSSNYGKHFSVSGNFLGQLNEEVILQHPEVLATILIVLENMSIAEDLRHSAVKTLHDIFLQNDDVKDLFIRNSLVKLLCDLFITGYACKNLPFQNPSSSTPSSSVVVAPNPWMSMSADSIGLKKRGLISPASKSLRVVPSQSQVLDSLHPLRQLYETSPTPTTDPPEKEGESLAEDNSTTTPATTPGEMQEEEEPIDWDFEEHLLCFLKAIALYGCTSSSNYKNGALLTHDVLLVSQTR